MHDKEFLNYIIYSAKKDLKRNGFPIQVFEDDELLQEAWLASKRASDHFDPIKAKNLGAKFSTYAYKFIFYEIRKFMFKCVKTALKERASGLNFNSKDNDINFNYIDDNDQLCYAMQDLNDDEIEILRMYFVNDMSFREIESSTGVSYTTVRNRIHRCLRKIRKKINEDYCYN
jgi:RNA polymerase sigma factor (sigma-70 family)